MRETIGTGSTAKILDFIYDESGRPFALNYSVNGGTSFITYYYVLNLQGDVESLISSSGYVTASYTYNAWGEILSVTDQNGNEPAYDHIANLNPLRYRGYYYDIETGWYYLQSRYYDPSMHRFINADTFASTGQGLLGCNMFAYCNNNPISRLDPQGDAWYDSLVEFCEDVKYVIEDAYDYVTNTDEQVVLDAKHFAFYKGVSVIKAPIGNDAFSFGIMVLGDEINTRQDPVSTIRHEYGHCIHFALIGPVRYTKYVAVPSVIGYMNDSEDYYSQPWEYIADRLGGVKGRVYTSDASSKAEVYWWIAMLS